jgi:alpha-tubulin suppressor-like RCC1 family protein
MDAQAIQQIRGIGNILFILQNTGRLYLFDTLQTTSLSSTYEHSIIETESTRIKDIDSNVAQFDVNGQLLVNLLSSGQIKVLSIKKDTKDTAGSLMSSSEFARLLIRGKLENRYLETPKLTAHVSGVLLDGAELLITTGLF